MLLHYCVVYFCYYSFILFKFGRMQLLLSMLVKHPQVKERLIQA
jgi:hypothetical protein